MKPTTNASKKNSPLAKAAKDVMQGRRITSLEEFSSSSSDHHRRHSSTNDEDASTLSSRKSSGVAPSQSSSVDTSVTFSVPFSEEFRAHSSAAESSSSFLRSKPLEEKEIVVRTVEPSHQRQTKSFIRRTTEAFTINKLRTSSVGLYGRDKETKILLDCLQRITPQPVAADTTTATDADVTSTTATGDVATATNSGADDGASNQDRSSSPANKEMVLIGGFSGVGKTVLATSLQRPVEAAGGAFVVGKFDASAAHRNEPYTGISAACREICGKLLMEPEEKRIEIRQKLVDELGSNNLLLLLISVVPDLEDVVGSSHLQKQDWQRESLQQNNLDAMNQQLHHTFRLFFRILCSQYKPLVMVIDDLQWADVASMDLLEVLIMDRDNKGLLIIGCYRSNEVDETHILSKSLRDMKEKSKQGGEFGITELPIDNLGVQEANQIIMALLGTDDQNRTTPLAEICHQRTHGNPFFLIFFLKVLYREEYLQFNLGSLQWEWDIVKIEEDTTLTENVVEVTMKKMNQIRHDLGQVLQIAAMLGSPFDEKILYLVWSKLHDNVDESMLSRFLQEASDLSFLEPAGTDRFRWVHDKIQEAALGLVPASELPSFQNDVGLILLGNLKGKDLDNLNFVVLNLLGSNESLKEKVDVETNIAIAKLSASAARKAKSMSAFSSTAKYANIGIHALPDHSWETNYDLTLDLYCIAAESEGIVANFDKMHALCAQVMVSGRSILDKIPVYFALARSKGRLGRFKEAYELCLDAIDQLNAVKIRKNAVIQTLGLMSNLFSTKKLVASLDADSLLTMSNPEQVESMKLLDIVSSYSYESKNSVLMLDACIKQVRLTLRHGISPSAPSALAMFGAIVSGVLGDLKAGTHIGDMATLVANKLKGSVSEALLIARTWGFMYNYSRPMHDSVKPLLHGYSEGLKFGDTEMASWCLFNHAAASFFLGKKLQTIDNDCRIYIPHIKDLGWNEIAEATCYVWHAVLLLMGRQDEDDPGVLLFKDLDREPKFHELSRFPHRSAVHVFLGDYERGADYAIAIGDQYIQKAPGHWTCQADCFARGVSLYAMARKTNQRRYKKRARSVRKVIRGWVQNGSVNAKHHLCLLDAEEAAMGGKRNTYDAIKSYQEGLAISNRSGFLRDAGLISERYAYFLLHDMGDEQQARFHVDNAIRYYEEWGAKRAVERLRSRYSDLLFSELPTSLELGLLKK